MTTSRNRIVELCDAGKHPSEIARVLDLSLSGVYAVLRQERPERQRKPRPRVSDLPYRIRGLALRGHAPKRIAELLECSRAYVYRHLP